MVPGVPVRRIVRLEVGLAGMIERATSYGGHLEAGPCPGTGWRVWARLRFDDHEGAG